MKNWMGQDIEVGDVVYNARRQGNSTTLRLGRVIKFNKERARVSWLVVPERNRWDRETRRWVVNDNPDFQAKVLKRDGWDGVTTGWNDVDTLIKIDPSSPVLKVVPPLEALT